MNSRAHKHTEQFRDSQDSLRGIYNADHHNPEVVNAHNKAYYASKAQLQAEHLKEQVKDSFASAKDTLVSAKDQVFGAPIKPIQGGMPGRNHPHPETLEVRSPGLTDKMKDSWTSTKASLATTQERIFQAHDAPVTTVPLARSEIEKDSIDSELAKEKLEERMTPIEGMPGPGRYHPHPDSLENVGIATKAVDKMKMGLDSAKASLVSAKDATVAGITSAREQVFGVPVEPIEGGMPGRTHPNPEAFEAPQPTLDKMKTGLTSAQTSIKPTWASAQTRVKGGVRRSKNLIWRKKVQPIEGGMPGRNHPHPERFYHYVGTPAPFATFSRGLNSAQRGLITAKNKVFRPQVQPIAGGMPGRNHPNAERFYAPVPTLMERAKTSLTGTQSSVQHGLVSAQTGLLAAKNKVFGEKIVPIEGGMPGRNHPHAERFYAPTPSLMDRAKTGWTATQSSVQHGLTSAQTGLLAAKNKVFGEKIVPIEGGMPGRNHPHAERFYAPTPTLMEKVQTGFSDTKEQVWVRAPGILETMNKRVHWMFAPKIQPIEGGMPGRNHPHAERFKVQEPGFFASLKEKFVGDHKQEAIAIPVEQGFSEIDTTSINQEATKELLEAPLAKETIHPLQGMPGPGRYHPMADSLRATDQGFVANLADKWKVYSVL